MMIILSHFYGQLLPSLLCMNHSRAERTCGVEWSAPSPFRSVCLSAGRSPPELLNICLPPAISLHSAAGTWLLCCFLYKWQLIKLLASFSPAEGVKSANWPGVFGECGAACERSQPPPPQVPCLDVLKVFRSQGL